ncbi:LysR family transcriptional regulator [Sphingomonas sp. KR1UV-12]|uniref:LysR family transcriptional regulator n=1 Tax=Sphingomonas aurea TaxID=3063994 RepID=A0ABT9EKC3_9SPHN|nr:LysR family transcriptional regulator [Sphingomonas sp. KR1UV-12]MDP1027394.1 LysR family transcriptional regulator [Sphingomonas sp. KR1UV-12]
MQVGPLKLKVQLTCGDGFALGPGKADLLDAIIAHGSISAAGRAIGMSYRRAWLLVDEMNRCFDPVLVETLRGGGQERGARVTETGRAILAAYRALEDEAAALAMRPACAQLLAHLRPEPRPTH